MRYVAGISDCWWEWWWWLVCVFCHMLIIIVVTIFLSPVLGTFLGSVQSFMRDPTVRVGPFYSPGLWAESPNQRPVFRSRDLPRPIRGQRCPEIARPLFVGLKKFYFPVLIVHNLTKCGGRCKQGSVSIYIFKIFITWIWKQALYHIFQKNVLLPIPHL